MLNTASSTFSCIAWLRSAASGTDTFGSPSVMRRHRQQPPAAIAAHERQHADCSPARPPRPARSRAADAADRATFTGTGFAQPISGTPLISAMQRKQRPCRSRSACTIGLSDTRPSSRAVGSPSRSAVHACAVSCTVRENSRTMNAMKTCAKLMSSKDVTGYGRLCEKRKDGIGDFRADDGRQLLARRAPHAGQAAERRQQRPAAPRSDAGHVVELRSQIAHRPRAAMERHGEAVRFVANPLDQQQRRIVGAERDRVLAVARVTAALPSSRCRPRPGSRARAPRAPRRPPTAAPCRRRSAIRSGNGPPCSSSLR